MSWRAVLGPYLLARAVVGVALAVAALIHDVPGRTSLLGWDADWYRRIAEHGYLALPVQGRRFFPMLPLLGRIVGWPLHSPGLAIVVLTNVAAFGYAWAARALAAELLPADPDGHRAADLMPGVVALAPAGFVLVAGYTEALAGLALCVALLAARRRRWWVAAVAGLAAGALRPTGVLLVLPLLIESVRTWRWSPSRRVAGVVATISPLLGLAAYLSYAAMAFGDPWQPFTLQTQSGLRGAVLTDPLTTAGRAVLALFRADWAGTGPLVHLPGIVAAVTLLVLGRRLLPRSHLLFAAATVVLAVTADGFRSFERYAGSAVPLLVVAAVLLARAGRGGIRWTAVAAVAVLFGSCLAAFTGAYVP